MVKKSVIAGCIADAAELTEENWKYLFKGDIDKIVCKNTTTLSDFADSGHTNLRCNGFAIVWDNHEQQFLGISPQGLIFELLRGRTFKDFVRRLTSTTKVEFTNRELLAVVVTPGKGKAVTIVKNGDISDPGDNGMLGGLDDEPTISFRCLARFFVKNNRNRSEPSDKRMIDAAVDTLQNGTIYDYSNDEIKELTKTQVNRIKSAGKGDVRPSGLANAAKVRPPQAGFVLIGGVNAPRWHRSGSFLIRHKGMSILLGVDNDAYFGCELRDNVETLKEAFTSLTPARLRGKNCPRQGEWYAEPIASKDVPDITDAIAIVVNGCGCHDIGLALAIEAPNSSLHIVSGAKVYVTSEGLFAKNPIVHHNNEEHDDMILQGWFRFERNTAKRSFSEHGVD